MADCHVHRPASMTVAFVHGLGIEAAAVLATLTAAAAPGLMVITVKPTALAKSTQLATRTPTRLPMTFMTHPSDSSVRMSWELVRLVRGR